MGELVKDRVEYPVQKLNSQLLPRSPYYWRYTFIKNPLCTKHCKKQKKTVKQKPYTVKFLLQSQQSIYGGCMSKG